MTWIVTRGNIFIAGLWCSAVGRQDYRKASGPSLSGTVARALQPKKCYWAFGSAILLEQYREIEDCTVLWIGACI